LWAAQGGKQLRALITGISGFVGSHLAEYLLAHTDWQVAGTVYGRPDNISHLHDRLLVYPAELSRLEVVRFIVEDTRPDAIFHLAAQPIPALSQVDPWFTLENNIRAQLNVLETVAHMKLPCRVLVVGSSEEYGQVAPNDLPIRETTPLQPTTAYAVSKISQDFLGLQYYLSHGVEAIRVRPFNHIGPRQRRGFVAPDFAHQIVEIEAGLRAPQVMVGALDVERDFSDVRDIVRGYYLALTQGEPGEVYNLGRGEAYSVRTLLDTLVRQSSAEITVVQDPARMRSVNVPRIVADCSKIRARTGWQPEIPFEQSLQDVLDFWRAQMRSGAPDPTPLEMRAPSLAPEPRAFRPKSGTEEPQQGV
jgi:GDP-4-dehydro-6-deoxy-D-mannose reductase